MDKHVEELWLLHNIANRCLKKKIAAMLTGVKWYLIVVLIYTFPIMIRDVEHFFIYLWAISLLQRDV